MSVTGCEKRDFSSATTQNLFYSLHLYLSNFTLHEYILRQNGEPFPACVPSFYSNKFQYAKYVYLSFLKVIEIIQMNS